MNKVITLILSIMLSCTAQGQQWQPLLFGHENGLAITDSTKWTLVTFLNCSEQIQLYSVNRDSVNYLSTFFPHYFINHNQSNDKYDLVYSDVWPGINAIFTSGKAGLVLTFICSPGANLNSIRFSFDEEDKLAIDKEGNLKLHNYYLDHTIQKPRVFQLDENRFGKILSWNLNWRISHGIEVDFLGSGSFDVDKPIFIEISNLPTALVSYAKDCLGWKTYY